MPKRKDWKFAAAPALAVLFAVSMAACNREPDVATEGVDNIDNVDINDVDTTPGVGDVDTGTLSEPLAPAPSGAIGTMSAPEPSGTAGSSPIADGSAVPPSPADGQVSVGDPLPSPSEAPMNDAAAETSAVAAGGGGSGPVKVALSEFKIQMPSTLPSGSTTFEVTNTGTMKHNLEIEGQGLETMLDEPLDPQGTGTLTVDLKPGTYRVYCPVDDHAEKGMDMELTVNDAGSQASGQ